jgi:hypothetical protein
VARGWESKSIEEQITEHQSEPKTSGKRKPNPKEVEQRAKRESVRLARSRTLTALETTQNERYRDLLERTLAHLDSELSKLG